ELSIEGPDRFPPHRGDLTVEPLLTGRDVVVAGLALRRREGDVVIVPLDALGPSDLERDRRRSADVQLHRGAQRIIPARLLRVVREDLVDRRPADPRVVRKTGGNDDTLTGHGRWRWRNDAHVRDADRL